MILFQLLYAPISFQFFTFIIFYFISSYLLMLFYLIKFDFILFQFILFYFILLCFILFYFISFYFIFSFLVVFLLYNFTILLVVFHLYNELRHTHKQEMELRTCVCTSYYFCHLFTDPCWGRTCFFIINFYCILFYFCALSKTAMSPQYFVSTLISFLILFSITLYY